ncbi:hypothetical protein J437_LFUL003863 [Ladona fulva]|uniref:Uncharacterized protein n=1 Tax=Ladona fulva TaxID=123851 RepID=A0A8K0K4U9_LADFU|nr:hypothetical protein J437_LFUL003863 [Ladona fulva]
MLPPTMRAILTAQQRTDLKVLAAIADSLCDVLPRVNEVISRPPSPPTPNECSSSCSMMMSTMMQQIENLSQQVAALTVRQSPQWNERPHNRPRARSRSRGCYYNGHRSNSPHPGTSPCWYHCPVLHATMQLCSGKLYGPSRGLTDAQKWNHFRRSLDRYLAAVADAKKPIKIPIIKNITTGIRESDPNPKFKPSFGVPSFQEFKSKLERSSESMESLERSEGVSALSDFHRENREADRKWGEMMERLDRAEALANSVHIKTSTPVKPARLKIRTPRGQPRRSERVRKPNVKWTGYEI